MSFKRHLVSVLFAQGLIFVLGLLMSILNARYLGPNGVGVMSLLAILTVLSSRISDLGFGNAFRYFSANSQIDFNSIFRIIKIFGSIIALIVLSISIGIKYLPFGVWNDIANNVFIAYLPTPFFYALTLYYRHLLHGRLEINAVNLSETFERILYILLFLVFVVLLDYGLIGAALSLSISTFFLFLQMYLKANSMKKFIKKVDNPLPVKKVLSKLLSYGKWSYFSLFIEHIILSFPVMYLKSKTDSFANVGYFNKAEGLANYPRIAAVPLSGLLFSYNAGSVESNATQRTEVLCRLSFWLFTTLFLILGLFLKPFIVLLYGKEFLPAAEVYFFLFPSVVLYIQTIYLSSAIAARGFNRETFLIRVKSIPFIIVSSYFLINNLDIIGAAISISLSFIILWVQYSYKFFKLFNSNFSSIMLIKKGDLRMLIDLFTRIVHKKN